MKKLPGKDATCVRRHARLEGGGQEETAFRFSKKQRKHKVREAKPGWRSERASSISLRACLPVFKLLFGSHDVTRPRREWRAPGRSFDAMEQEVLVALGGADEYLDGVGPD